MFHFPGPGWAVLISMGGALAAHAQQPSAPSAPASAAAASAPSASAAAGDLSYRSAVEGYQPFADEKVVPWRGANDNAGRIGGWREYAREAQGGAAGSPAGHGGHGAAAPAPAAQAPSRPASAPQRAAPAPAPAASRPATAPGQSTAPSVRGQDPHAGHGKQ